MEMVSATLVLRDEVWAELQELYVTARFLMREEGDIERLEMWSLLGVSWRIFGD
jgi:hypothetical protein